MIDAPSDHTGDLLTTVAFQSGEPDPDLLPGIETVTADQLGRLMDLPETDAAVPGGADASWTPLLVGGLLSLSAPAGVAASTRLRPRVWRRG